MADHEITTVHLTGFDLLGAPFFDSQILRHVVTRLTLGLRVAALAELSLLALGHDATMVAQEAGIVLQERDGHRTPQRFGIVARRALGLSPLLFVLVTAEALAHRRQSRSLRVHYARVARYALPANFRHGQVLIVIDGDLAARARRRTGQHRLHLVRVAVTAFTDGDLRHALPRIMRGHVVTTHAAQARGLAGHAASDASEVNLVRKTRWCRLTSTSGKRRQREREPQQESRKARVHQ
jgi:hypothetical protein